MERLMSAKWARISFVAMAIGPIVISMTANARSVPEERKMVVARLNYVELPVRDISVAKAFYETAFGWSLTDFAPTYAATVTGDTDIGLQADQTKATKAPLPVIEVDDLEAALEAVTGAGGQIVRPIFAFPGGRRFQFLDPAGNEVAVTKTD
jgi:hypothetical protein